MIDLVFHNRTTGRAFGRTFFKRICDGALPYLKIPRAHTAEVSITLVGATAMRTLNRTRRRIDKPTDVLSFPLHMKPITGYTSVLLGDLFICPDIVRAHAKESHLTMRQNMEWTVVHGLLHLAGYDHEKSAAAGKLMRVTEQKILKRLNRE
jgi:probable rRNA maturation factor